MLVNYFGDRISDVGSNQAPDSVEQGRTTLDVVLGQKIGRFNVRFTVDNVTDAKWQFTQGDETQREFKLGRVFGLSVGVNLF